MPLISVIVPVYKVEPYLDRCVRSILAQTHRELEVILVDDGSPDNCGKMCDAFAAEDDRVKVIHKENGGLSDARNAGLAVATGAYIGFIDSDDYIEPAMYEKLLQALEESDAQISICNYAYVDEQGNVDKEKSGRSPVKNEVLNRRESIALVNTQREGYWFYVTAWNKLYKRELFEDLRFADGRIHEDEFIAHHLFGKCNRVATVQDTLYMYVQRSGSIMAAKPSVKSLDAVYALHDRYVFYKKERETAMAKDMAMSLYGVVVDRVSRLYGTVDKRVLKKAVNLVAKDLMTSGNLRCVKLQLIWLKICMKNFSEGDRHG